jgi:hypothetical protein
VKGGTVAACVGSGASGGDQAKSRASLVIQRTLSSTGAPCGADGELEQAKAGSKAGTQTGKAMSAVTPLRIMEWTITMTLSCAS